MSNNKNKKQDREAILLRRIQEARNSRSDKEERQDWSGRRAKKLGVKRKLVMVIASRL